MMVCLQKITKANSSSKENEKETKANIDGKLDVDLKILGKELGAKVVLPIHLDNEKYPTDIDYMKKNFEKFEINYKVLDIEEEIEF